MSRGDLSLYIHVPFCIKKCSYCDFLSAPASEETIARYVDSLVREAAAKSGQYKNCSVRTVFLGGGTPSLLSGRQLGRILECLGKNYRLDAAAEISMELNPGTADPNKLREYREAGINRVSVGLQSANDDELRLLGRIHSRKDFEMAWEELHRAGFCNLNVDIMSALPGQSAESFKGTLEYVSGLGAKHVSAYSLIIEPGTAFYELYGTGTGLPDEDTDRQMYLMTGQLLGEAGFKRYEISNYALPGYECRHNTVYWERGNYLGLGLGSSSLIDGHRMKNRSDLMTYMSETDRNIFGYDEYEELSLEDEMSEAMFLGLRLTTGVSVIHFRERYGISPLVRYRDIIQKHIKNGLLEVSADNCIRLTPRGMDICNYVMCDFV